MNVHTELVKLNMEIDTKTQEIQDLIAKFIEEHGEDNYNEIFKEYI